MNPRKKFISLKTVLISILLSSLSGMNAHAEELDLATSPLFVSSAVESNVYFILDDSGSMDWEMMIGDDDTEFNVSSGLAFLDGYWRYYIHPAWITDRYVAPPVDIEEAAWLMRNHISNPLYYDPSKTFSPWPGTDAAGNDLYTDADPENARRYPYSSSSSVTDLTVDQTFYRYYTDGSTTTTSDHYFAVYYKWPDDEGDGVIEASDNYETVEIKPENTALFETVEFIESDGSITNRKRTYEEEMQNFANWFQYYRKREFSSKVAIGSVIDGSDSVRMGLDLINDGHVVDAASMSSSTNRSNLLETLYESNSSGGTPLRRALKTVGEMFTTGNGSSVTSPILSSSAGGTCQQNFQVLMTDGYWNGSSPSIGNEDADGTGNDTAFDGGNYADTFSNTLADVAMYYYENDLATDLTNDVPTISGIDEATHQHLVTYTVAFGLSGTLDQDTLNPDEGEVTWTNPSDGDAEKIDDLWHAAYNGRGEYLNAAYPDELAEALDEIIKDIAERSATASAVAINSAKLTTDTIIYLAEFNTFRWQGEIYAYQIENTSTGALSDEPKWKAGELLTSRDLVENDRAIITYNGSAGTAFQWDDISSDQQNDLKISSSGVADSDTVGEARLNYLRGDRSNEGTGFFFRERSSLLGDVVNSGPVYVAAPDLKWPDTAPFPTSNIYSDFKVNQENRNGVIYVGSNDGMLHAFDEDNGEEILAYIPNILYSTDTNSGLHYLTSTNYVHKFYNDLTPTISDVYLNKDYDEDDGGGSDAWNTILLGALRGGGRGIYALNVTDPSTFSEANADAIAMWEFTNSDDSDLGYTFSKPQVALANNGEWVAIFGNGYNSDGSGESALFIVDIEKGIDGPWTSGDYIKIKTGAGSPSDINGLSTPTLADLDGDGDVDRVYAGDLEGNMWVFDLSSSDSNSWALANSDPLFTTIGNRPITAQPALSSHPTVDYSASDNAPNVMVYFGSGQYLEASDLSDTTLNHFYGVWDSGTFGLTSSSLTQQSVDGSYSSARVMTKNEVDYTTDYGWFFELEDSGERSVTTPVVRFDVVFFNSFIPDNDACSGGGSGYKMAVSSETGGAVDDAVFDSNNDGVVDGDDSTSNGTTTSSVSGIEQDGYLPEPVFIEDLSFTADTAIKVADEPAFEAGRLSWQELLK